jgi:DNA-binding response OmpR family regulator
MNVARVLVVEDEPDIALGLQLDLQDEGHQVEVAADGIEASRRGREPGWDVILLDVMLPLKDGFEVCRDLRRASVRTPIMMLTAKAQDAEKVMGLDMGADDYVTKPFSPRELRARVRALLRRSQPAQADIVHRIGDCEIDFGRAEVRWRDRAADLTAIELKMLQAFVRQPGRVITRAQIIGEVWGDIAITDRVVDTHVVKLRRHIETDPAAPRHIVSVRGLGYRFEP